MRCHWRSEANVRVVVSRIATNASRVSHSNDASLPQRRFPDRDEQAACSQPQVDLERGNDCRENLGAAA